MHVVKISPILAVCTMLVACRINDAPTGASPATLLLVPYVGQGHGVAIVQGHRALVFDAGPPDQGGLRQALRQAGVDTIEGLFITHPDLDHWGGLDSLLRNFPVRTLVHGQIDPDRLSRTFGAACRQVLSGCQATCSGQSMVFSEGLEVDVLWPDSGAIFEEPNDGSLVLRTHRGDHGLLLVSGDLDTLHEILVAPAIGPVDVLQLGHHGSKSSGHLRFLGAASPKWIAVQAGIDNDYGHPTPDALARARAVGAEIFRPLSGDIDQIELESRECVK